MRQRLTIGLLAGAALVVVGLYAIDKMRRGIREPDLGTHELIENFRELHHEGELSDGEYRTIRAMLSQRLLDEMSDKPGES